MLVGLSQEKEESKDILKNRKILVFYFFLLQVFLAKDLAASPTVSLKHC